MAWKTPFFLTCRCSSTFECSSNIFEHFHGHRNLSTCDLLNCLSGTLHFTTLDMPKDSHPHLLISVVTVDSCNSSWKYTPRNYNSLIQAEDCDLTASSIQHTTPKDSHFRWPGGLEMTWTEAQKTSPRPKRLRKVGLSGWAGWIFLFFEERKWTVYWKWANLVINNIPWNITI